MKAVPDSSDVLVFECDFDEPLEKVWRALTEPRLLEAWLTTTDHPGADSAHDAAAPRLPPPATESAQRPDRVDGGTGLNRGTGRAGSSDYEIVTAEPNRRVRYRWRDRESAVGDSGGREVHSLVTVELTPCPAGGRSAGLLGLPAPAVTGARRTRTIWCSTPRTTPPRVCR